MRPIFLLATLALVACAHRQPGPAAGPAGIGGLDREQIAQLERAQALRDEGLRLLHSKDPQVKNPAKAFERLLQAAQLGDPVAMDSVGGIYSSGAAGVPRSCAKGLEWFGKSATMGYGLAANNMAYLYVTCDDKKLRDPGKAESILQMVFANNPSMIAVLDTYAALLAEQGNFRQAATTMRVVLDLQELIESNPERIDESKQALALYRKGKKLKAGFDPKPERNLPHD